MYIRPLDSCLYAILCPEDLVSGVINGFGDAGTSGLADVILRESSDELLRVRELVFVTDDRRDIVAKREEICRCLTEVAEVRGV